MTMEDHDDIIDVDSNSDSGSVRVERRKNGQQFNRNATQWTDSSEEIDDSDVEDEEEESDSEDEGEEDVEEEEDLSRPQESRKVGDTEIEFLKESGSRPQGYFQLSSNLLGTVAQATPETGYGGKPDSANRVALGMANNT